MKKNHITRDYLAADRTELAIDRTFLAYFRTFLTMALVAATLIKLFKEPVYFQIGFVLLILSGIILVVGIIRTYSLKEKLKKLI